MRTDFLCARVTSRKSAQIFCENGGKVVQEKLFEYVREKGVTQRAIAKACDMTEMAVSSSSRGERRLTAEEYARICVFLGVSLDKFVDAWRS